MTASYGEMVVAAQELITNKPGETEQGNATIEIPTAQNIETAKVLALLAIADRLDRMINPVVENPLEHYAAKLRE